MATKKSVRYLETFQEIDTFNAADFENNLILPEFHDVIPLSSYKTKKLNMKRASKSSKVVDPAYFNRTPSPTN